VDFNFGAEFMDRPVYTCTKMASGREHTYLLDWSYSFHLLSLLSTNQMVAFK